MRYKHLVVTCLLLVLSVGCDNSGTAMKTEKHNELGMLPKLLSLPRQPLSVKWTIEESTDRGSLRALLQFSAADKTFILNNSPEFEIKTNDRLDAELFDSWLPEEARAEIETQRQGDEYELLGVVPLQPDLFTQNEMSPYVNGSVTPLGDGYVLVWLYAM